MASVPNTYAADPAHQTLAFSLLTNPESTTKNVLPGEANLEDWDLQMDWNAGIQSAKANVFHPGKVIGFSRLRSRSNGNSEYIAQIPRLLFAKHVLRNPPRSETTVFIVHPTNFDAFTPIALLNDLLSAGCLPSLSREDAIRRLDSVQLLPVFDLQHAGQAIAKVSETLQQSKERKQQSKVSEKATEAFGPSVLLLVAGLDALADGVIRNSNPAKGTAVLAVILRSLTRMTRTHKSDLCIILVNTSGLGAYSALSDTTNQTKAQEDDITRDDGIHSIFQVPGSSLLSNLLMRTLDQGIDTHILLSDVKAAQVVEVIKDRSGTGLGKWGIWSRQR